MTTNTKSLQDQYAPQSICFGCGPANTLGLQIKSHLSQNEFTATWQAKEHHQAFPGILNGGIIGALLDCHCNWTAAITLMQKDALTHPPCTVTAEYTIKLLRPTPHTEILHLKAKPVEIKNDRVVVEGEIVAGGKTCATCRGTFVAVKEGHPAYHRW